MADKALVYIHGKGGKASEAESFRSFFSEYDVYGFDYKAEEPWGAVPEYREYFSELSKEYSDITVIATSMGAYFLMISGVESMIRKAYFISPIVNMEKLIQDMMTRAGVSEEELRIKKLIQISANEVLSWEYLVWVREHPIVWKTPTVILYGEKDDLQSIETVTEFTRSADAGLTVMPDGEHWFHTPKQNEFKFRWISKNK